MLQIIEQMSEAVNVIEKQLSELTKYDEMVQCFMAVRDCGKITA